ncbi:MAG: transglutaminase domain-containing protein [Saccharofermentanales bacterium]
MNTVQRRKIGWIAAIMSGALVLVLFLVMTISAIDSKPSVKRKIVLELGEPLPPAVAFFLNDIGEADYIEPPGSEQLERIGSHSVELRAGNKTYNSVLEVLDRTPPEAETIPRSIWMGETLEASGFISRFSDLSPVTITYEHVPDFTVPGVQKVRILIADDYGNKTFLTSELTVLTDTQAPVISGVKERTVYMGDTVLYRDGITVTDNRDPEPVLSIDTSKVNPSAYGKYEIVYIATDRDGNSSTVRTTVKFIEPRDLSVTQEDLDRYSDQILDKIVNPEMTDKQRLRSIFDWIAKSVTYTGYASKSDWRKGAYLGLKFRTGDCFTFYAVSRALLTRAGYECVPVERVASAPSRHYWLLVQYEGEWYHFDPSPRTRGWEFVCFMRSDPDVAAYTEHVKEHKTDYFTYDPEGLPVASQHPLP